ncbi:hypothetical protein [Trinickia fusca]|uniref:hypothetical protein n=1 Tax=Trinickia fusca TaxID=2419777 RepID=UPI001601CAB4|nr:hypothetical protein [Trinickia fusca]
MDLHWIAGVVVLLILVAVSAYRDALDRERSASARMMHGDRPNVRDADQGAERFQ